MSRFWEQLEPDQLNDALDEYDEDWRDNYTTPQEAAKDIEDTTEFIQICEDILGEDEGDE